MNSTAHSASISTTTLSANRTTTLSLNEGYFARR